MASKDRKITLTWSQKDVNYLQRFIVDVLIYTRLQFGVPKTELPYTNCEKVVYKRADFLERACVTTLRICLVMRDMWRRMFQSRIRSSEINEKNVCNFLAKLLKCCPLIRGGRLENCVAVSLALSNEIMLFVSHERLRVPFSEIVNSNVAFILTKLQLDGKGIEIIEELFDTFDNLSEYTGWITCFITKFAIPYKSSEGISDVFLREDFTNRNWEDDLSKELHNLLVPNTPNPSSSTPPEEFEDCPENLEGSNLQDAAKSPIPSSEVGGEKSDNLFVPNTPNPSSSTPSEEFEDCPENLKGSNFQDAAKSPIPSSEVGGEKSDNNQPIAPGNFVEETSQAERSPMEFLEQEVEDILTQMRLSFGETSQNPKGAISKRKSDSN